MTDTSLVEPQQVSIEQLAKTNADLAAQVELQTNVCAYFKKVHADAIAAVSERDKQIEQWSKIAGECLQGDHKSLVEVVLLNKRIAELEAIAKNIADQKTTAEMIEEHGDEEGAGGDFEYAYDKIIEIARTAFAPALPLAKDKP